MEPQRQRPGAADHLSVRSAALKVVGWPAGPSGAAVCYRQPEAPQQAAQPVLGRGGVAQPRQGGAGYVAR
jgi:hypothetical protein